MDFPSSDDGDVNMQDADQGQAQPLFFAGTPSVAGTPSRRGRGGSGTVTGTPASITARRAMGMSTPKRAPRTPLFAREFARCFHHILPQLTGSDYLVTCWV